MQNTPRKTSWKLIVGCVLIGAAIILLIISATQQSSQYYLTVEELLENPSEMVGKDVRISGVVIGDTIQFDDESGELTFTIVHVPGTQKEIDRMGGLAAVLHAAVNDPSLPRLQIIYQGSKPDLLKDEAQAILTGKLGADGAFHAGELLLKCPSKYESAPLQTPNQ